ncbi:VOC family protein [Oceanobacillus sp. J11TS1]|uniref:VOC family protein n=1 Tax=Oceanobacillus sp. J11TS1 TaxID=2807191 RepID=UPI001B2B337E|nr:VOC family protein [Oceanobacillus sp. J11TS1]GIO22046.1 hypothetical protein J11TS1_06270 [Oceanobacillus sp. J11TS1]
MNPLVKKIDTVFIQVSNLENSLDWYKQIFNLEIDFKEDYYLVLKIGETPLTLIQTENITTNKLNHAILYFYSKNIEGIFDIIKNNTEHYTEIKFEDGVHFFEFKDNNGNPLGICSY